MKKQVLPFDSSPFLATENQAPKEWHSSVATREGQHFSRNTGQLVTREGKAAIPARQPTAAGLCLCLSFTCRKCGSLPQQARGPPWPLDLTKGLSPYSALFFEIHAWLFSLELALWPEYYIIFDESFFYYCENYFKIKSRPWNVLGKNSSSSLVYVMSGSHQGNTKNEKTQTTRPSHILPAKNLIKIVL